MTELSTALSHTFSQHKSAASMALRRPSLAWGVDWFFGLLGFCCDLDQFNGCCLLWVDCDLLVVVGALDFCGSPMWGVVVRCGGTWCGVGFSGLMCGGKFVFW